MDGRSSTVLTVRTSIITCSSGMLGITALPRRVYPCPEGTLRCQLEIAQFDHDRRYVDGTPTGKSASVGG
jgi:hypothetical protein